MRIKIFLMLSKINNIILSFVLLITTAGLTINLHYCAGDLYSVAIDSEAANCCEDENHMGHMNKVDQNNQCHNEGAENNHCDDETLIVKISDDFTKTAQNINISNSNVIILFNTLLADTFNLFASNDKSINLLNYNDSPPDKRQIFSFIQSYLL